MTERTKKVTMYDSLNPLSVSSIKMRIGMIIRKLNVKGGTQRQMLSLARELTRRGHEVIIYAFAYDKEKCYPELLENMNVVVAPEAKSEEGGWDYYRDFRFLKKGQLASILRESHRARLLAKVMDPDLELLNPHDQVSYRVAYYYKKFVRNIPSVWNMNDLPIYQFGYDKAQEMDPTFHKSFLRRLSYRVLDAYEAYFIRRQDRILVVDFFNRGLVKKYLGLQAITVRNGPDLEHFNYRERKAPGKNIKLLTSGILLPHRRFEDSIAALPLLMKQGYTPTLTIVGDCENDQKYYEKLKGLVVALGLQKQVLFAGRISESELIRAYNEHDVYVFQHHWQSDGLSQFEAAATGLPMIVSRTAGCHEVLTDGKNALFINPKNPADIAEKVKMLIDNPDLYLALSREGNTFIRNNFSWKTYTDDVLKVFGKVLQ